MNSVTARNGTRSCPSVTPQELSLQFQSITNVVEPDIAPLPEIETPLHMFCFSPVSIEDVLNSLISLDTTKANGPDGIEARFLKLAADLIEPSVFIV